MISQNHYFQVQKFSQKNLPKYLLQFSIDANKHPKYSIDTLQFPKPSFSGSKIFTKISSQVSLAVLYECKQTSQILHRYSSIPKILIFRFNIFSPRKNPTFHKKENLPSREFSPILDGYHAERGDKHLEYSSEYSYVARFLRRIGSMDRKNGPPWWVKLNAFTGSGNVSGDTGLTSLRENGPRPRKPPPNHPSSLLSLSLSRSLDRSSSFVLLFAAGS